MGYYYSDPQLGHTATFGYDSLNRLHTAVATGTSPANYNWTYTYDRWGNMSCSGSTGGVDTCPAMQYNTSTNMIKIVGNGNTQNMGSDPSGNLIADLAFVPSRSYTWDAEGRLTSVASPYGGSVMATYSYNALGQRVQRSGSWVGTYDMYEYYDAFGNLALMGDNTTGNEDLFPRVGGRLYGEYLYYTTFLHANALGSTGVTTGQDGYFIGDEIYDPWGQRWGTWNNVLGERFAGMQRRDKESGLDHTPNRMFASPFGRWLSPDPGGVNAVSLTDPQTWNMYAYVRNNPTTLTDPSGLEPPTPAGGTDPQAEVAVNARPEVIGAAEAGPGGEKGKGQEATAAAAVAVEEVPAAEATAAAVKGTAVALGATVFEGAAIGGAVGGLIYSISSRIKSEADLKMKEEAAVNDTYRNPYATPEIMSAHKKGARPSTAEEHEEGEARKARDRGGERGDRNRKKGERPIVPRVRPYKHKGPWPLPGSSTY